MDVFKRFAAFIFILFIIMFFLLLLQKKGTKGKESGKDNHTLFVRPLHRPQRRYQTGCGSHLFRFASAQSKTYLNRKISLALFCLFSLNQRITVSDFKSPVRIIYSAYRRKQIFLEKLSLFKQTKERGSMKS